MRRSLAFAAIAGFAFCGNGQTVINTDTVLSAAKSGRVEARKIAGDSLVSSFIISIPGEILPHKHPSHSEHVMVLSGEGRMLLGDSTFTVRRGDLIFIAQNTKHGVQRTGNESLRVLSIQAPLFDGKDRVPVK